MWSLPWNPTPATCLARGPCKDALDIPRTESFDTTVATAEDLESPLDCKEIEPVHSEGDQPWDFFGRNDAKAETPPVFLPGESQGWGSLVGCCLWGHTELDTI